MTDWLTPCDQTMSFHPNSTEPRKIVCRRAAMFRSLATYVAFVSTIFSLSAPALAGNEPEEAQQRAEQDL